MAGTTLLEFADGALRLHLSRIATLELNAPERRNAMSAAMWAGLSEAAAAIAENDEVRVLLVRGAGGKAFCAGAHIGEFEALYATAQSARDYSAVIRAAQENLRNLAQPTIAVIEGACVGGGCGIALACDLRFSAADARFAITPARLGLVYSYADTAQLVEKIGPARAKDILFSGRMLDAQEALRIGLIDRVCAGEALAEEALAYAQTLAGVSQASIRTAKQMINRLSDLAGPGDPQMDALADAAFSSGDFREGYNAFLAKRPPSF